MPDCTLSLPAPTHTVRLTHPHNYMPPSSPVTVVDSISKPWRIHNCQLQLHAIFFQHRLIGIHLKKKSNSITITRDETGSVAIHNFLYRWYGLKNTPLCNGMGEFSGLMLNTPMETTSRVRKCETTQCDTATLSQLVTAVPMHWDTGKSGED